MQKIIIEKHKTIAAQWDILNEVLFLDGVSPILQKMIKNAFYAGNLSMLDNFIGYDEDALIMKDWQEECFDNLEFIKKYHHSISAKSDPRSEE